MYKILVISDSHGKISNVIDLMNKAKDIDRIFHLGDLVKDAEDLQSIFNIPIDYVAGNCDFYDIISPKSKTLALQGKRIYLCHGHHEGVKYSLANLEQKAKEKNYDIILFGHTHVQHLSYYEKTMIMNPGSISSPRDGRKPGFAIIQIDDKGCIHGTLSRI